MKNLNASISGIRPTAYWGALSSSLCINAAVFLSALNIQHLSSTPEGIYKASQPFALAILPVLAAVVSRRVQDVIAHFKLKHVLPGCRALQLAGLDPRINLKNLKKNGKVPPFGSKQNAWWYSEFYQKVKFTPEVVTAQRRYLLFRDLAFIQGVSTLAFVSASMLYGGPAWWGFLISLTTYILFVLSTRNRGKQFVQTAMAVKES